jgi:hypothetical protein
MIVPKPCPEIAHSSFGCLQNEISSLQKVRSENKLELKILVGEKCDSPIIEETS